MTPASANAISHVSDFDLFENRFMLFPFAFSADLRVQTIRRV